MNLINPAQTSTGKIPLPEMGPGSQYCRDGTCVPGGLYLSNGSPSAMRPPALDAAASAQAGQVTPLDVNGNPDPNGKIIILSIGMSNTVIMSHGSGTTNWLENGVAGTYKHSALTHRMGADLTRNPKVVFVNGAHGGIGAENGWADPACQERVYYPNGPLGEFGVPGSTQGNKTNCWQSAKNNIANLNSGQNPAYSEKQVQVIWMKHAQHPVGGFPSNAQQLNMLLEHIARRAKEHFPNARLMFLSSRTYSYVKPNVQHNEPSTYEGGLAVRWMIEHQQGGDPNLNWNPGAGTVKAPLMLWGAYLWNDGAIPRSDGLTWNCNEYFDMRCAVHPMNRGAQKNSDQVYAFFKSDPLSTAWYLNPSNPNAPTTTPLASPSCGQPPLTVQFSANATANAVSSSPIVETVWSFGDGTFSHNPNGVVDVGRSWPPSASAFYNVAAPQKTFKVPGLYKVYVTVSDQSGKWATGSVSVQVGGACPP